MKERTFYTINLDIKRIAVSIVILVGLMAYFFILGNSIGKKSVAVKENTNSNKEETNISGKSPLKSSPEENMVPAPPEIDGQESEVVVLNRTPVDNTKPIPVPVSPVVDINEDALKKTEPIKTAQPNTLAANTPTPAPVIKKPAVVYPIKKPLVPQVKTPTVLEEKNFYTIQLGAFSSQEQANKFKENVAAKNKFPGKFQPYVLKQRDFFVVRVGRSTIKEELEKIVRNLDSATQASAMIVKNNKP